MGNIPVYNEPNLGLQPTETGIEALTRAAYRGNALYGEAAAAQRQAGAEIGSGIAAAGTEAIKAIDHEQINAGAKHGADMWANLTDSWNAVIKNPKLDLNDPAIAKKWEAETLEPALEDFQKGFITEKSRQWGEQYVDKLRQHFFEKTSADMSRVAGARVESNLTDIGNRFSNAAIGDPSSVPFLLDSIDHQVGGIVQSSPYLRGADAAKVTAEQTLKLKMEVVKSGVYGAIQNAADPEAVVKDWVKRYPDYINGPEAETFARAATQQRKVNMFYDRQGQIQQKELATQAVNEARNKIWKDNVSVDTDGRVSIKPDFFRQAAALPGQNLNAPNATETAKTLIDWGERQQKPEKISSDPATMQTLTARMFDQQNPTSEIDLMKAQIEHKLSTEDFTAMHRLVQTLNGSEMKSPVWKDTMEGVKQYFQARGDAADPFGGLAYARFAQVFIPEYLSEQRSGKLPPNALDLNDPQSLIRRSMAPLSGSLTDSMHRLAAGQSAFVPPPDWQFNPRRQQYRDPSGKIFDINGQPVK